MNTLYLHIGTHKTATTTIQHFLAENDELLKTKGYTYPRFPFTYPFMGADRNGLFLGTPYLDAVGVRHKDLEENYYQQGMDIVHELFDTYPNVIISNERLWYDLYRNDGTLMKQLLADAEEHGYQIKLIVYVRRQDKYIESFWNEQIKSNIKETRDLIHYIEGFKHLKYGKIFSWLGDMAGDENLIMKRFDDVVRGEGILADLMKSVGLELTDDFHVTVEQANTQIYGNITEIKRTINEMDFLERSDANFLRLNMRLVSEESKKNYPCSELSVEERTELMKPFEEENQMLADRFIGDGKPLFSTDYSGLPKKEANNPEYINDIIRSSAAGDVILLRRIKENEATIHSMEKTIAKLQAAIEKQNQKIEKQNEKIEKQSVRIDHLMHPVKALLNKK